MNNLRQLPSVDDLIKTSAGMEWTARCGRPLTLYAIRNVLDKIRREGGEDSCIPTGDDLLHLVENELYHGLASTLVPVINASGVIIHTNLGRSPMSTAALRAVQSISQGYCTLEYDLEKGKRGSRFSHVESLISRLTGAEGAIVVNNNAAAILLSLTCLAQRRKVAIARSQLVEIGGGFRIPEVMKQSGARLVEVGTTNRVNLSDYEAAIQNGATIILRVHHSNYKIIGFTHEPTLKELSQLGEQYGVLIMDDLGSGALVDTVKYGLPHEPMVQESLASGASLVCFSGDKLLGGPQAGIIAGRDEIIEHLKKHPLVRALRPDKLCLAALSATLNHYLKDEVDKEIPIWRCISLQTEEIKNRARLWSDSLQYGDVIESRTAIGGGSLPEETLPTYVLSLAVKSPDRFIAHLRRCSPPVIARVENGCVLLDPRTVFPEQDDSLLACLRDLIISQA